jgi:hypothetical protein
MSVDVNWLDSDRRILHYCFRGVWNWDEYFVTLSDGRKLQQQVTHRVCVLNDLSATDHLPDDFIEKARSVSLTRPLNSGIAVYISTDYHFKAVYEILCRLYPDRMAQYLLVTSRDEALAILNAWFAEHQDED